MNSFSELKAVTFDAGGTLIKPHPSVGHVYAEVAARHGLKVPPPVLNQRFAKAWRNQKNFNHRREEWAALVAETFAGLGHAATETFFPELYERFAEPSAWQVFEDVIPTLEILAARGLKLGVISNWDERLRPLLGKLGLAKYFDDLFISCEVGFPKPSPVIFEQAAKRFGLAPHFIMHAGDDLACDFEGAKNAGFQARLLDRSLADPAKDRIRSLYELQGL